MFITLSELLSVLYYFNQSVQSIKVKGRDLITGKDRSLTFQLYHPAIQVLDAIRGWNE